MKNNLANIYKKYNKRNMLDEKQKTWVLKHTSAKHLTTDLNLLLKANKIGFEDLDGIYKYFENFKTDKLL